MGKDKRAAAASTRFDAVRFLVPGLLLVLCLTPGCDERPPIERDKGIETPAVQRSGATAQSTDAPAAKIVVEDMHAGVWITQDNASFEWYDNRHEPVPTPMPVASCEGESWGNCNQDEFDTTYRHGVLFQMGLTKAVSGGEQTHTHGAADPDPNHDDTAFWGVYIKHRENGNVVETFLESFPRGGIPYDWLDIRGVDPDTNNPLPCVIDPRTAYSMFRNETSVTTECDPIPTTDPLYHCSRNRSIHAAVEARYLITYWADAEYETVTGPTEEIALPGGLGASHDQNTPHVSYTFRLPNEMIVDRWHKGCYQGTYTGVTEVRILHHKGQSYHLGYPHTVTNGGKKGG